MNGIEETNQIATGGAQPGAGRNVCNGNNLYAIGDPKKSQSFPCQRVLHFVHVPHDFGLAVLNANSVIQNRSINAQVHVLVNSNREDETAMLAVERRAIGSTAAESQTKRSLGDNHVVLSMNRTALAGGGSEDDQAPGS